MYKCLTLDHKSFYDKKTEWTPGKWLPKLPNVDGDSHCGQGYHLGKTLLYALLYGYMPCVIYKAEGRDAYAKRKDKIRYGKARITKDVTPDCLKIINDFLLSIKDFKTFKKKAKNFKPPKYWKVFNTHKEAKAAWWSSPCQDESLTSDFEMFFHDQTREKKYRIHETIVDIAYENNHDNLEHEAGKAADLMVQLILLEYMGCDIPPRYTRHVRAMWNVWKKGYGLYGTGRNTFYVYKKK